MPWPRSCPPTVHLGREDLGVVRPRVVHLVRRQAQAEARRQLLQLVLRVAEPPSGGDARDRRREAIDHETRRRLHPGGQVDGADDRLEAVGEDRVLAHGRPRPPHPCRAGPPRRRRARSATGARACVLTTEARSRARSPSGSVREGPVEVIGDDQAEHGVAEELEALVGRQPAGLRAVRAVRQRLVQQAVVDRVLARAPLRSRPLVGGRSDVGRRQAASTFALT